MNLEHTDFGPLFISLVRFSKTMLEQQGAFLPHGAIVSPDGKVGLVGAQPKEQQPGAQVTLQLLEGGLRGMAAKGICRAAGIAMDTRIKVAPRQEDVGRDAIWVILEERGGASQAAIVPYWKSPGGFTYGEAFTQPEKPRIFGIPAR